VPRHPLTAYPGDDTMPAQTTPAVTTETTPDQPWDRRPALTLLIVIVLWYIGAIAVTLTQAL
jgi:hypothetical protein